MARLTKKTRGLKNKIRNERNITTDNHRNTRDHETTINNYTQIGQPRKTDKFPGTYSLPRLNYDETKFEQTD